MTDKNNKEQPWKKGKGWVQWNPPRHHPCYEEWMNKKELDNKSKGV